MVKKMKFQSVSDIERYYIGKKIRAEQAKINYYKMQSRKYLDKVNPDTWLLYKYESKITKRKNKYEKKIKEEERKVLLEWNKSKGEKIELPKAKKKKITKTMAKAEFQLRRKLEEADENWLVIEITTGRKVHWRETQWGHYITASINATCFEPDNVRPQSPWSNRLMSMGNNIAKKEEAKYRKMLVQRIWEERVRELEQMAEDSKKSPAGGRGSKYFNQIYEESKKINDAIFMSHPDWHRDAKKDLSYKRWKEKS